MSMIDVATRRPITVIMCTVAIIMFGLVSLLRLKVNLLPDLTYPTLTIRTDLPGSAPLEVENLISKPIEEASGIIKNVRQVRSISRSGQSDVIVEFLWGTNMDFAGVDVREKIDLLDLPDEADRPLLLRFDPANEPIMRLALTHTAAADGDVNTLKALRTLAEEDIKNTLESVEGTAAVKASGGLEDEIQVLVDQEKIAQLGLSIQTITQRLGAENVNLSGGRLEEGSQRFLVRTINEFQSVEEIGDAIIPTSGSTIVHLRDVATVTRSFKDRVAITRFDGRESVELAIYKEGDANTVQVARQLKQRIATLKSTLPENIEITQVYDQSVFIDNAVNQVKSAAAIGGVLAVFILYCFLKNVRATVIIAIAIPVSVIGTFLPMFASDITLNIMSLGGIALAVGLLVDNSIVVLENIVRRKNLGESAMEASLKGTKEVAGAVVAATLTTVAVFFPMVFVTGIAGQLFRDQALTVTFALLLSLLVALTLIPMLSAWSESPRFEDADEDRHESKGDVNRWLSWLLVMTMVVIARALRFVWAFVARVLGFVFSPAVWVIQLFDRFMARVYPPLLRFSLRQRALVMLIAGGMTLMTAALLPRMGTELIPQLSQGEFFVDIRLPASTPLAGTDRVIKLAQEAAADIDNIELTYAVAGTGSRLDASPVDAGENAGRLTVQLGPGATRESEDAAMAALRDALRDIPGASYKFSRPALFTARTPLEVEVRGDDLEAITRGSNVVSELMAQNPRLADIKSTIELGNPEIQIRFDHERAANLGLLVRDVADRVVNKVRGQEATRYSIRDRKIPVLVRSVESNESSIDEIRNLIVNPASERPISLGAIADIRIAMGPSEIRRIDQERVSIVSANLSSGDLGSVVLELEEALLEAPLPEAVSVVVSGQSTEMRESFISMQFTLALAIFLVYLVMAAQFESIIHPLVILFTIPLALVGAVLALYVTGTTINVVVFIGAIMLAGIVVNNAIVLVDLINQLRASGMARYDAIMQAGQSRLRPILMTTATTTLGLLPMALGLGDGAEVRAPMAITVIGGLVLSTALTLLVIPVVYSLMDFRKDAPTSQAEAATGTLAGAVE
ncbi:MAG: efflux RND transporter permease subunit [Gammaproteobacteria bacterium]